MLESLCNDSNWWNLVLILMHLEERNSRCRGLESGSGNRDIFYSICVYLKVRSTGFGLGGNEFSGILKDGEISLHHLRGTNLQYNTSYNYTKASTYELLTPRRSQAGDFYDG